MAEDGVRHSKAESVQIVTDEQQRAQLEAKNALLQFDKMNEVISAHLEPERPFRLRPSLLLDLNRCATKDLDLYSGNWRPTPVTISKSAHSPVGPHLVPSLVEHMCDYVNENWANRTAVHLAAYVLWRVNWIHPFTDGNGRTARATSNVVLCVRAKLFLPGTKTIPEQILQRREDYYSALEDADRACDGSSSGMAGGNAVERLEAILDEMLAVQLESAYAGATGHGLA